MLSRLARGVCNTNTASISRNSRLFEIARQRWASTLVVSDPLMADGSTPPATQSAVTAATALGNGNDISLLVVGDKAPTKIPEGVGKVIHANVSGTPVPETIASAIQSTSDGGDFTHIIGTSTKFGATMIPRAAAILSPPSSPITDIIEIIDDKTFIRPIYAGNALAKVLAKDPLKVLSIRPTSFEKTPLQDNSVGSNTVEIEPFGKSTWVSENVSGGGDRPDLSNATIVVSGGRGMKNGENFQLLEKLIDALDSTGSAAAIGASRAAVDAGFVPNDWQVGQTGKVVAPDLYIAVGISGAIQHLSGMKESKVIVAINKDPEAPIFQVADYGLVADLFKAVPELTEKLQS